MVSFIISRSSSRTTVRSKARLVLSKLKGLTLSSRPAQSIGLLTVSVRQQTAVMNEEEMRYRVTAVFTSTLQIVVQARSIEEAESFSEAIDFSAGLVQN